MQDNDILTIKEIKNFFLNSGRFEHTILETKMIALYTRYGDNDKLLLVTTQRNTKLKNVTKKKRGGR